MFSFTRYFLVIVACFLLMGCAKTLGIYNDDFGCPRNEEGQCIPVEEAHKLALEKQEGGHSGDQIVSNYAPDPVEEEAFLLNEVKNFQAAMLSYEKCLKKNSASECSDERARLMEHYRTAEDRGQAKVIHSVNMDERVTRIAAMEAVVNGGSNTVPVRQPDTIMELHVMPYRTNFGALASERVIWVVVQAGEWTWATTAGRPGAKLKLGETH